MLHKAMKLIASRLSHIMLSHIMLRPHVLHVAQVAMAPNCSVTVSASSKHAADTL